MSQKKGKLLILKNVRQLKGTTFSVTDQLPPLIGEQRIAQVPTLNDLRSKHRDKQKDNIRLEYDKLYHNKDIVSGEFELNHLPALNFSDKDQDYNDIFHSEVVEYADSFFQGHCLQVTSTDEACKARDALFPNKAVSKSYYVRL